MGWFNSVLKFQKKFDPLSYNISKAAGLVPGQQQQTMQSAYAAPQPYTGFGQQVAPVQQQMPARQLVGAPRQMGQPMGVQPGQPMGQPMPMGQPGAPRPLVGAPRLQQQATVNALRTPTPIV
jgi:hypothetical protein